MSLGKVTGNIRRALSVTTVRANALCLLDRLTQLGPGAGAAARRRAGALVLEGRPRRSPRGTDGLAELGGHVCPNAFFNGDKFILIAPMRISISDLCIVANC